MRNLDLDHENVLATTLPCERHCQATAERLEHIRKQKYKKALEAKKIFRKETPTGRTESILLI
jgi:hypothetical protein